ncbi:alpha/beta hydrolase [Micromonospora sp. NPDC005710]|uniref:alpha/beta hydrolase n=1 Tax=Micromonospora sp. NPDC005710 TaxID=3157051 RepID=UPI00340319C8
MTSTVPSKFSRPPSVRPESATADPAAGKAAGPDLLDALRQATPRAAADRPEWTSSRPSPAAVCRFFCDLGPVEGAEFVRRHPKVVGQLEGAPPALRYAANRRQMRLGPYRSWEGQYLLFDEDAGRMAVVYGDLCHADRIAVLVPGANTRVADFRRGLGGREHRAPAQQAGNLHRAAVAAAEGRNTRIAVIAWLGYRPPSGFGLAAARQRLATLGAVELLHFVDGLTAVRPRAAITVLAHSYGSAVVGVAARRLPAQVTDIAVFGSPGMGVRRAAELGSRARLWAAEAPADWTRRVPGVRVLGLGHGQRPAHPAFGARPVPIAGVAGHDYYLAEGAASLAHLAAVVAGVEPGSAAAPQRDVETNPIS